MSENTYPVSCQEQIDLFRQCLLDANEIVQQYDFKTQVASQFFAYRVQVLSNRIVDHDVLDLDADIPLLNEDES